MNKIRELRKKNGLSQTELANMINVAQGTVSGYENGKYDTDSVTIAKLAQIFGVTVGSLIGTEEKKDTEEADEIWILREKMRRDPDRRVLFDLARSASIEDVRRTIAVLDALKKTGQK